MKFQKRQQNPLPQPLEAPAVVITEGPLEMTSIETAVAVPEEKPEAGPRHVCGINGCATWYENPIVMERHRQRQHDFGGPANLNQPKPRHSDIKLA
jgi:hypothetical protein